MASLSGKVAWVTGAGSGIGLSGGHYLAKAGATVVLTGRRPGLLEDGVAAIRKAGGKAEAKALDVGDDQAVAQAAGEIQAQLGPVDILVNSAGSNVPNRSWATVTPA